MSIEVVTDPGAANYPFVVEARATENWCSAAAHVTLLRAWETAERYARDFPRLPVRIKKYTGGPIITSTLPLYRDRMEGEKVPDECALWSGAQPPPKLGDLIFVRINNCGWGRVEGYGVDGGWLFVHTRLENPPDWHRTANPGNPASAVMGAEIDFDRVPA